MKRIRLTLTVLWGACAVSSWGSVYQMGPRGDAKVEVNKVGGELKVICTFSPQTKFDSAINAKFNDAKGDSLCKKGIARYLNVGSNDLFSISGLYSAAPVKKDGGKLRYSFAVPVAGCRVVAGSAKPKIVSRQAVKNAPKATNVNRRVQSALVKTNAASQTEKVPLPAVEPKVTPSKATTTKIVRSASYMSVVKYKEINGQREVVSRREYHGSDFGSRQEFDQLCAKEFARIRALGEENLRAVRNFGKQ